MGARGDAFPPIVPSGPLAPIVHYMDNTRQMQAGELVYMDYGSDLEYYNSDITRTWPVSGRFSAEQEKMYRCVLEARNAIIAAMKPGVTIESLQDVAAPSMRSTAMQRSSRPAGGTSATSSGSRCTT